MDNERLESAGSLLPCPFCGGPCDVENLSGFNVVKAIAGCNNDCPVQPFVFSEIDVEDAIQRMNTRAKGILTQPTE